MCHDLIFLSTLLLSSPHFAPLSLPLALTISRQLYSITASSFIKHTPQTKGPIQEQLTSVARTGLKAKPDTAPSCPDRI